jgi:hypothetical protein
MSDVLLRWAVDEVGLATPINNAEEVRCQPAVCHVFQNDVAHAAMASRNYKNTCAFQDLATGFVLGELLHKLNLQPDFDKFDNSGTPDALINNFTRLHPVLKEIGVKFDTRVAQSLIRQERGVASKVLYGIKRVRYGNAWCNLAVQPEEPASCLVPCRLRSILGTVWSEHCGSQYK